MSETPLSTSLDEILRHRRSIRTYEPDPIDRAEVLHLLEIAGRAPSSWNVQPWRFVAVDDPETKAKLQEAAFNQPQVGRAPVVLAIYCDMVDVMSRLDEVFSPAMPAEARETIKGNVNRFLNNLDPAQQGQWGKAQAYIVLGYLLAILEAHGYGTSPMVGFDPAKVKTVLHLPDHAEIVALVAFGKPGEEGRPSIRHDPRTIVRWT